MTEEDTYIVPHFEDGPHFQTLSVVITCLGYLTTGCLCMGKEFIVPTVTVQSRTISQGYNTSMVRVII